ncbi:MAG: asparagine synthase (glutamine-hydrolyzing) [Myxococcota bacterium]
MCGIWGWWQRDDRPAPDDATIRSATEVMRVRGPDDFGTYRSASGLAMGFRRLSIIDLAGGHQPMGNASGTVWVTLNGEIYGFERLREQLTGLGHTFETYSDTEVIVHGYEQWGDDVLEHLCGMFAIAIWDERRRRLLLARDRLGIKPLYVFETPAVFGYASDLRALTCMPEARGEIDPEALALYLYYGYVPAPWSIRRGIRKLRPGERCVVDSGSTTIRRYWDLRFDPTHEPDAVQQKRFEQLFADVVEEHLVSDVALGSFLSGGMDSTSVVQAASEVSSDRLLTFNLAFEDPAANESTWATQAAETLGTDHHELSMESDPADHIAETLSLFPEPFGDPAAVPNQALARMIRGLCTVALSGDGGDEVFAGYSLRNVQAVGYLRWLPRGLRSLGASLPGLGRFGELSLLDDVALYARGNACQSIENVERLMHPDCRPRQAIEAHHALMRDELRNARVRGSVNRALFLDQSFGLSDRMLPKVDVTSMAHSLEVRVPFLDHRVVEFASRLPESLKQKGFGSRSSKKIIRRYLARRFPDSFIHRPKLGFSMPMRGDLMTRIEAELVSDTHSWRSQLPEAIRSDEAVGLAGSGTMRPIAVWTLYALAQWNGQDPTSAGVSRPY